MTRVLKTLEVEGFGEFPVDMLRYDECFPASERDSGQIVESLRAPRSGRFQVKLYTWQRPWWEPSKRWDSFCWKIVSIDHGDGVRT